MLRAATGNVKKETSGPGTKFGVLETTRGKTLPCPVNGPGAPGEYDLAVFGTCIEYCILHWLLYSTTRHEVCASLRKLYLYRLLLFN